MTEEIPLKIVPELLDEIEAKTEQLEDKLREYRRDFHKHAEAGWTEFRTASLVAARLAELGYEVKCGSEVIDAEARMGLPAPEELEAHYQRAQKQGADSTYLQQLQGGFTGVVASLERGEGPVTAFRFDLDAVQMQESQAETHRPVQAGFASVNAEAAHSCGHDGHTAIGLGLAELLMEVKERITGTVKLIFQPAEEGVRGAKSMVAAGVLDEVDYLYGLHLGLSIPSGEIFPGTTGFLATSKFDAYLQGQPAHAGASPEQGKNALLAAATAVTNLYAISRHSEGPTRINVGQLEAGSGRNVIPAAAKLVIETRGISSEVDAYMYKQAESILTNAARMYELELEIEAMGGAKSGDSDQELIDKVAAVGRQLKAITKVNARPKEMSGSEDFTYMMEKVQNQGGKATYIVMGSDIAASHHTAEFDIDESALPRAAQLLAALALT